MGFYCVVANFYIPVQQNRKNWKHVHARLKHFIKCSELNINDHVSLALAVMHTGIRAFVHTLAPSVQSHFPKLNWQRNFSVP